jgi:hypothetical protein
MRYPYSSYDAGLLHILGERGCVLGLNTEVAIAGLAQCDPLTLPRFDTNDLPKQSDATLSDWTCKVLG